MYQQIRVAMPPGVRPGQVIQIRTPAGQVVQVSAPAGVPPGGTFMVNVPAAPVAPQQVQMTPVQQQYRPPPQQQQYRPPAAPAPYRPPPTRYQPITSQPNLVNTGSPIMRDYSSTPECTEGGCYKCVCCNFYSCCCCFCFTKRVAAVRQGEIGIIEKFGKFVRVAEPGEVLLDAPMGPCVPFETLQRTMNLRVRQQPVDTNTKTKDNVFVTIQVVVLYRIPDARMAQLAAYKLQDLKSQLNSFVDDTLRTTIAKVDIDDVFTMSHELAAAVKRDAAPRMTEYGYEILDTLVVGIEPEASVKRSMNEINYQKRMKAAQVNAAEAQKAIEIKLAEARAEAKHLSGIGLARMRTAMVAGFAECVDTINVSDDDKFTSDATELLLTTQYMDMLEQVAADARASDGQANSTNLFLPMGMGAVDEMRSRITIFANAFKGT